MPELLNCPKFFRNDSSKDDLELRNLIAIALASQEFPFQADHEVAFWVKNYKVRVARCQNVGLAYRRQPPSSPWRTNEVPYLVLVRAMGAGVKFPLTNEVYRRRLNPLTDWLPYGEYRKAKNAVYDTLPHSDYRWTRTMQTRYKDVAGETEMEHRLVQYENVKVPYGGKRSPLITYNDWREQFVGTVAHELRHIQQFINHEKNQEHLCERAGLRAIEFYRSLTSAENTMTACSVA